MKYLFVAAHPDDEVLGCGGTIARLAKEGHDIFISILGEGISSRYSTREEADPNEIDSLRQKSRKVAYLLGAKDTFFFNLPDNRFDTIPLLEVAKMIENVIDEVRPEVVYTQHGGDLNVDHVTVYRATLTATRPVPGQVIKRVLAYEAPSSTEWSFNRFQPEFKPSVFIDITDTFAIKMKALAIYDSEVRSFPHPRSEKALRHIAGRWGTVVGLQMAEAFELIRCVV
jgi:LmbE family N-acetylglucosaminyl deacetylase